MFSSVHTNKSILGRFFTVITSYAYKCFRFYMSSREIVLEDVRYFDFDSVKCVPNSSLCLCFVVYRVNEKSFQIIIRKSLLKFRFCRRILLRACGIIFVYNKFINRREQKINKESAKWESEQFHLLILAHEFLFKCFYCYLLMPINFIWVKILSASFLNPCLNILLDT